jgi:4-aminobutyrate--pyruvate transaminase
MNIKPDILTCAKALSASFLPISAVMVNEKVYQALMSESDKIGTWGHGFTYSGHPVAPPSRSRHRRSTTRSTCSARQAHEPDLPQAHPVVRRPSAGRRGDERRHDGRARDRRRQEDQGRRSTWPRSSAGNRVYNHSRARGLFIRNMGERVAICPPLIIN